MNTFRPVPSSHYWLIALKILALILGLYLSAVILGRVFSWLLLIVFSLVKVAVFVVVAFMVLHFFLKVLFKFDLYRFVFGFRYHR